jgi:hypothetical protein
LKILTLQRLIKLLQNLLENIQLLKFTLFNIFVEL